MSNYLVLCWNSSSLWRNLLALRNTASAVNIINEDNGDKLVRLTQGRFRHLWEMKVKREWKLEKRSMTERNYEGDNEHVLLGTIFWTFNGNTQYLVLQQRFCAFMSGHPFLCHFLPFSWLKFLRHMLSLEMKRDCKRIVIFTPVTHSVWYFGNPLQ